MKYQKMLKQIFQKCLIKKDFIVFVGNAKADELIKELKV